MPLARFRCWKCGFLKSTLSRTPATNMDNEHRQCLILRRIRLLRGRNLRDFSVTEVPDSGKNHGHSQFIGGSNELSIPHRSTRLDSRCRAGPGYFFQTIRKWEKRV